MPDTDRFPEQLGIQLYALFEKYKHCRQIRKPVLAKKKNTTWWVFPVGFSGWGHEM